MSASAAVSSPKPRLAVKFSVERRKLATCEGCHATFQPEANGEVLISPHLRERHGFTDARIEFEIVGESICPPMVFLEARQS